MTGDGPTIRNHASLARTPAHEVALDCIAEGIDAARPARVVEDQITVTGGNRLRIADATYDLDDYDEVVVLGGGKAAGGVASALQSVLGDRLDGGVVVTDEPTESVQQPELSEQGETGRIDVVTGDHPVPSERGLAGARRILDEAAAADEDSLVLAVVTGGASALLPAPASGIELASLQTVTELLLACGASIDEINAVRKHCSRLKGGQLATTAAPATVAGIVFSDVVGDDLSVIASGPTVPDESTYAEALAVLDRYDVEAPEIRMHLEHGNAGEIPETPGSGDPAFERVENHLVANAWTAIDAAREVARAAGYDPLVLSASVRGEAREAALTHVAVAEEVLATGNPVEPPAVVLSSGETTVTLDGDGVESDVGGAGGGPNQEFALAAALELPDGAVLTCVDTDGIDGASESAGAVVDSDTLDERSAARAALDCHDAGGYLDGQDALIDTGPTGTNVNDLRVLVVGES